MTSGQFVRTLVLSFTGFVAPLSGCGDVCDRHPRATQERCTTDVDTSRSSDDTVICTAEAERAARCAARHRRAYCEWFEAFVAEDYTFQNEYTACVENG